MTLVEIIAALALAAAVLTTVLTAYGRAVRQERRATQRLEAVRLADELLAEWFAPDGTLPLPEESGAPTIGRLDGHEGWTWQVSKPPASVQVRATKEQPLLVDVYRLEIVAEAREDEPRRALVSVEFAGAVRADEQLVPRLGGG